MEAGGGGRVGEELREAALGGLMADPQLESRASMVGLQSVTHA